MVVKSEEFALTQVVGPCLGCGCRGKNGLCENETDDPQSQSNNSDN